MGVTVHPSQQVKRLPTQFFASLVAKVNRVRESGADLINLGQGNPDLPTPTHIVKALQEAAEDPIHHRYPPFTGLPTLKAAIVDWYRREHGVMLDPEAEVAILFGAKAGLVEIAQCLLDPGDVCLVPDPGYPDYWSGIALAGAEMVTMPLLRENGFLPDLARIPPAARQRAKLMFLNYPNNPTGACAPEAFFDDVIRFADEHNIVVAHDFAYGAIGFDGRKPVSFLSRPGAKEVGVEFYTLSKTYNMAGWRVGFALGNRDVIRLINLIQDHYYCSLFGAVQMAAVAALTGPQDCVRELVATYQRRRDALYDELRAAGWDLLPCEGSFFAWLPVPKGFTSAAFADLLLEEAHVAVAPGIGFGACGEGYVRVGLLAPEARLREAARRMAHVAQRVSSAAR
ncbi:pyridoxal phosphate-dependent aminotransferase [Calditerricola satsumensis]|uniref:Diaminopimelate aminotransferase n=1 Tax=Calditerricola satsumensis TaxID=373054 RepID=A0A8J3FE82_9BACI|nr:pyridoxal phosphate-dependent aminotransferase [Calditerricola satsumensis]GGJ99247.1 diaminopimelate aminotransferase [Calditerricola satsumensis]